MNPLAIRVLAEIGIDASGQHSKSVGDIPPDGVDAVVTLCAEEECPLFPGQAVRLHWGLSDPAAAGGSREERLDAFRKTRDDLRRRIEGLFI